MSRILIVFGLNITSTSQYQNLYQVDIGIKNDWKYNQLYVTLTFRLKLYQKAIIFGSVLQSTLAFMVSTFMAACVKTEGLDNFWIVQTEYYRNTNLVVQVDKTNKTSCLCQWLLHCLKNTNVIVIPNVAQSECECLSRSQCERVDERYACTHMHDYMYAYPNSFQKECYRSVHSNLKCASDFLEETWPHALSRSEECSSK